MCDAAQRVGGAVVVDQATEAADEPGAVHGVEPLKTFEAKVFVVLHGQTPYGAKLGDWIGLRVFTSWGLRGDSRAVCGL